MTVRRQTVPWPGPAAPVDLPDPPGPAHSRHWKRMVPVDVVQALLQQREALPDDDPRHGEIRRRVVELCLPVAHRVARWFQYDGHAHDDLVQVASLGLVQALNRYDPERGFEFLGYAVPTMCGELRHYLRDRAWALHVPRAVQEIRAQIGRSREELTQRLRRAPTMDELAAHLDLPEADVVEAELASSARRPVSLNRRVVRDEPTELAELLGESDIEFERVEYHMTLWRLIAELPERDRQLIAMRFFGGMSQVEIGQRMGFSQMHVSRLLNRTLAVLRRRLLEDV